MKSKSISSSILIALSLFVCATVGLGQEWESQIIPNELTAITVFLNNAEIQRTARVNLPSGKSEIIFENISSRIITKGIKVNASNDVKVYAVTIENGKDSYKERQEYKAVVDSMRVLKEQKASIRYSLEVFQKQQLFLESNMKINSSSSVSFSDIDEAEKYFMEKISRIQTEISAAKRQLEEINDQEAQVLKMAETVEKQLLKSNAKLKIILESKMAAESRIDVKYLVSNALWKPLYAFRAEKGKEIIDIEYQAQVYNDTGTDWEGVPMTLAILDSSDDIDMPSLEVWNLENNSNQYAKRRYASSKARSQRKKGTKEVDESDDFDELEIDDLSTRFELKDVHRIPSDAMPHIIDVTSYQKKVAFYNLSIPKIKSGGYLIARISDWESLGLIDGVANLYYNNTFQGFTNLKTQQVNDTLDLSLGKESSFSVSRKKVSSKSRKNLIGFNIKENLTYEILLKNNKSEAVAIQLKDQIPVSTSKDIVVIPTNLSNGKLDPLTGEVSWNVQLGPNESRKIALKFSIKYPKNQKNKIQYNINRIVTPRYF